MKDERREAEELASGLQYLTEITLPLGLPDYSTVLEDSEKRTHMDWHEQTRKHTIYDYILRARGEAAAATFCPGQIWTSGWSVYVHK